MSVGNIVVSLIAKTGSFETDVNRSAKLAAKRAKEIDEAFTKAGKVIGASLVAGAAVAAAAMQATINRMDEMSKAAQKSSMSTEAFSKLAYAGSLADVSMQDLQTAMGKLAKEQIAALDSTSDQAEVFGRLGIAVVDAKGKLRDTGDVFADFADRFQRFQGSPQIVADGMTIFGRNFQTLIPLMKDGSQGLKDAGVEAEALAAVLSTRAGQEAEAFNDNLTRLSTAVQGLAVRVTSEALPAAVALTDEFVSLAKEALGADGFITKLAADGSLKEWAQNSAIAVAVLAESLFAAGKTAMAVLGSFQAVWADIELAGTVVQKGMWGGLFFEENRKDLSTALEKRNKTVETSNDRLVDLWNYNSTQMSDALRKNFADQASAAAAGTPDLSPKPATPPAPPKTPKTPKTKKTSGIKQAQLTDEQKAVIDGWKAGNKILEGLQFDWETLNATGPQKTEREAWYAGATEEQITSIREWAEKMDVATKAKKALDDAVAEGKKIYESTRTPAEELSNELARLDELLAGKHIDWDTFSRGTFAAYDAFDALGNKIKETTSAADEFALEAARNIQSHLGDSLFNILDGNFDDIGSSFVKMIKRMAAEALAADLARSMFGDYAKTGKAGGWMGTAMTAVGAFFGGGKAAGGPVESGKSYLVGERGPEYFTPSMSGNITPNGAGGGVTIHQTNNFSSNVDRGQMAAYAQRIKAATIAEIRQANLAGEALTG